MKIQKFSSIILIIALSIPLGAQTPCDGNWEIKLFSQTSEKAAHPSVTLTVDNGYKILGGGASLNFEPGPGIPGSLLTESYPKSETEWIASGKDHSNFHFPSTITAYAIAIFDPNNCWEIEINSTKGSESNRPSAFAQLSVGYKRTGGGGAIKYNCAGNLLVKSWPSDLSNNSWEVSGKDQTDPCSRAYATSYVIGIKPTEKNKFDIEIKEVVDKNGLEINYPSSEAKMDTRFKLVGGGAYLTYTEEGPGILLYKSYPNKDNNSWVAKGKDHRDYDRGYAYSKAIGVRFVKRNLAMNETNQGEVHYIVRKGDNLSKISKMYYKNAIKFKIIFKANKDLLNNPDLIFPGQKLLIPTL